MLELWYFFFLSSMVWEKNFFCWFCCQTWHCAVWWALRLWNSDHPFPSECKVQKQTNISDLNMNTYIHPGQSWGPWSEICDWSMAPSRPNPWGGSDQCRRPPWESLLWKVSYYTTMSNISTKATIATQPPPPQVSCNPSPSCRSRARVPTKVAASVDRLLCPSGWSGDDKNDQNVQVAIFTLMRPTWWSILTSGWIEMSCCLCS